MKIHKLILLILVLVSCGEENKNAKNIVPFSPEQFLTMAMKTKDVYWNEDTLVPEKVALLVKPYKWPKFAFNIPDTLIPKDKVEADKFYTNEHGIYIRQFIFHHKFIDTLLSKEDKDFMQQQAVSSENNEWKFKESDFVELIDSLGDPRFNRRYVYSQPVFSKDSAIAIVKKLNYWRSPNCMEDCAIGYVSETTHYFKKDNKTGSWQYYGGSGAFE